MSFGKVLNLIIKKTTKDVVKFEDYIESLTNRFEGGCPSEEELENITQQVKLIYDFSNNINDSLSRTSSTTSSLGRINNTLKGINVFIKTIPAPSAVAGVGVPIGFINSFADSLDMIKDFLSQNTSSINQTNLAVDTLKIYISNLTSRVNELNLFIENCAIQYGRDDLLESLQILSPPLQERLEDLNKNLRERLKVNSEHPYIYRSYQLILEEKEDSNQMRIVGIRLSGLKQIIVRKLYDEDDSWSYATDLRVLIREMEYTIDLLEN